MDAIYINPDKSPKAVRREVHGKRLLGLLKTAQPDRDWRLLRARGIISADSVPIVEVVPQGVDERTKLAWSPEGVAQFGIDFNSVSATFRQQLQSVDTSAWTLS